MSGNITVENSEASTLLAEMFDALVAQRRSSRGFRPDPVSQPLLNHIFTIAQQAPSNCNTQPWVVHVVSGATAARMSGILSGAAEARRPLSPDVALTQKYSGVYRDRQIDAARTLFAATNVQRDDMDARYKSAMRNFHFFDAPHAAFLFLPVSNGVQKGPPIGVEEGPPFRII